MNIGTTIQKVISLFLPLVYLFSGTSAAKLDYSDKLGKPDYIGFKDKYEDFFRVGTAVSDGTVTNPATRDMLLKNFNTVTLENDIKQPSFNPSEGVWNLDCVRTVVDFCEANNIKVRGHTLLWLPIDDLWVYYDDDGNLVDEETMFERFELYVKTVMTEFSYIDEWDILNEAFMYNRTQEFKPSPFIDIAGVDGLYRFFKICEKYKDENDKFYINETKILNNGAKEDHAFKYIEKWIKEGVKIDGIGIQGHWVMGTINENPLRLQQILNKCRKLNLDVQFTEMDYTIYFDLEQPGYEPLPDWMLKWHTFMYQQMFKVLRKNSDVVSSVTFWGIDDAHSYPNHDVERTDYATLFDRNGMPKNEFFGVCDF